MADIAVMNWVEHCELLQRHFSVLRSFPGGRPSFQEQGQKYTWYKISHFQAESQQNKIFQQNIT